jgi:hypothetical protein
LDSYRTAGPHHSGDERDYKLSVSPQKVFRAFNDAKELYMDGENCGEEM